VNARRSGAPNPGLSDVVRLIEVLGIQCVSHHFPFPYCFTVAKMYRRKAFLDCNRLLEEARRKEHGPLVALQPTMSMNARPVLGTSKLDYPEAGQMARLRARC
jgi:hypothetical protein